MTDITNVNELIFIIYSVASCIAFVSVLAVCVCGCRKGDPKNDFLGLDGMVKITNPDENVNHLPAVGNYESPGIDDPIVSEYDDPSKRPSGGSNPHRSLPDIPVYTEGDVRIGSDNGVSGDTSSELYATVEDKNVRAFGKRHTLPNGIDAGPSLSHQSSISQSDSNYARLKENPYDKVKKSENPYANVQSSDSKENDESSREHSPRTSWKDSAVPVDTPDTAVVVDSSAPERSRRSSGQISIVVPTTSSSVVSTSPTPDIPAATAVAGRVAASQDLPYMTPPITQPQHFSGDSQDSSRGYTSISVREPLANIMSQTPSIRNRRNELDPHYSTVSDDSDEMYAAIVEPNGNIYTTGSETYAQIQPVTVAEIHGHVPANDVPEDEDDDQYEPAPQPPSVDSLKHVAHVHSRQASSSSCTSSVANLGSPKPEKRQANSPLPPPPAVSPDLYSRVDKSQEKEENPNNLSVVRNLEDMYAKVHKNKKRHEEEKVSTSTNGTNAIHPTKAFVQSAAELSTMPFQKLNNQTDSHSKKSWSSKESFEDCKNIDSISVNSIDSDKASNSKSVKRNLQEHCYETLNKSDKKSPRKSKEINNDEVFEFSNPLSGPESLLSNDPGYEQLNPQNRAPSDIDPNYEVLRPHRTPSVSESSVGYSTIGNDKSTLTVNPNYSRVPERLASSSGSCLTEDGYSVVNKNKKTKTDPGYEEVHNQSLDVIDEPNYESMPSECADDNYATIHQKSTESESDPNYESVKYLDVTLSEPPYERLHDDETKESSDLSEYEQISGKQDNSEMPGYERIKDSGSKSSDNSELSDSCKVYQGNGDALCIDNGNSSTSTQVKSGQVDVILTITPDSNDVKVILPTTSKVIEEDIFHV